MLLFKLCQKKKGTVSQKMYVEYKMSQEIEGILHQYMMFPQMIELVL